MTYRVLTSVALAAALAGCGGDDSGGRTETGSFGTSTTADPTTGITTTTSR